MTVPHHPSIARIASVARAMGELSGEVVFIGGAIAPLLQTNPAIPRVRATDDVDAIVASTGYAAHAAMETRLRALGFTTEATEQKHVHRWRSPGGILFDLVPIGDHLGGTGGTWDRAAIETAVTIELEPGLTVKHVSAPGFLALKWAAFWDRGEKDPYRSEDLEDILALLVSRDTIVSELLSSPEDLREHVRKGLHWLEQRDDYEDLVAAYLGIAMSFTRTANLLRARLRGINAV